VDVDGRKGLDAKKVNASFNNINELGNMRTKEKSESNKSKLFLQVSSEKNV